MAEDTTNATDAKPKTGSRTGGTAKGGAKSAAKGAAAKESAAKGGAAKGGADRAGQDRAGQDRAGQDRAENGAAPGPTPARLRTAAAERGRALTAKVPQLARVEDPKAAATAAWTAVRARKILVGGVTAGVLAAGAGSFHAGRRAALRRAGPLTRMTGGRL
ncbi:hypothetical protein DVA86_27495 [Streptomyces armeniacus]|uniref:Uncharacterized protein n=1 Tax=Streptomyces armeniacus TaxID=83291 RepID=A0A345XW01_9ACTN|nr:hypothetical protein [Streptomyces armeniacus]AXK35817.1 hypothetical protein DVA86_27495 [Streptomyces armeniacus]